MRKERDGGSVIGLDLGGTKLMAGLFNEAGDLIAKEYVLVNSLGSRRTPRNTCFDSEIVSESK